MNKGRVTYMLIALLLVFLIADAGLATWMLTPPLTRSYVVQPSETVSDIASAFKIHEQAIVEENDLRPGAPVESGQILAIPMPPLGAFAQSELQLVGVLGTLLGTFVSFWLCSLSGLVPRGERVWVYGISLGIALIYYTVVQISSSEIRVAVTPLFVFNSVKDGFTWSALLLLLSRALGLGPVSA